MTQYREAHHLPQPTFSRYGTSVGLRDEAYAFGSSHHMLYVLVAVRHHRTEHGNWKYTLKKAIDVSTDKDALVLDPNDTLQRGAPFASADLFFYGTSVGVRDKAYAFGSSRHMLYVVIAVRHHRTEHGSWKYASKKVIGVSNDKDELVLGANGIVQRGEPLASTHFSRYGTSVGFRDEAYAFGSSRHMLYVLVALRHHRIEHGNWKHTSRKKIGVSNDEDALVLGANDTVQRGAPFASIHLFTLRYVCRLSGRS